MSISYSCTRISCATISALFNGQLCRNIVTLAKLSPSKRIGLLSALRSLRGNRGPVKHGGVRWILLFSDFRLRRPATRVSQSKCISLRRTGRPTSRCNQTPARGGRCGREESRDVNVIGNIREGDSPRFWSTPRGLSVPILPSDRPSQCKRHAVAFSRVHLRTFARYDNLRE